MRRRTAARHIANRTLLTFCCTRECFKVPDTEFTLSCLVGCLGEVEGLSQLDKRKYLTEKLAGKLHHSLNRLPILIFS